ncbi:MAG: hypothetical protein ACREA4_09350 [Nitrososphaera sp.]
MRRNTSEAFDAPVYDVYSSNESSLIEWECVHSGLYHVCDDSVVLEVLSDGRPAREGECGEVVGTNLYSYGMPFIRFSLEDIVVKGPEFCPCGKPFSTLSTRQGRFLDRFHLPDGRVIHTFSLDSGLTLWIRNFSLLQEREDLITAQVVASSEHTTDQVKALKKSVQAVLGPGVEFVIEFVESIKPRRAANSSLIVHWCVIINRELHNLSNGILITHSESIFSRLNIAGNDAQYH